MSSIAEFDLDGEPADDAAEEDVEEADGGRKDTHSETAEGDLATVTAAVSSVAVDPDSGKEVDREKM